MLGVHSQNVDAADTVGKQEELDALVKRLQEQVARQEEQLQQLASGVSAATQERQSLEAALGIGSRTITDQQREIAQLRELVRNAEEHATESTQASKRRDNDEETESCICQLREQVQRQEEELREYASRACVAATEKQSLEAALEIAVKT